MIKKIIEIESRLPAALAADRHAISREIARIKSYRAKSPANEKTQKRLFHLEKRLQACFVNYGADKNGFLSREELDLIDSTRDTK